MFPSVDSFSDNFTNKKKDKELSIEGPNEIDSYLGDSKFSKVESNDLNILRINKHFRIRNKKTNQTSAFNS